MASPVAEEIAAGRLSQAARAAAGATAFELVGTYFADAPTWKLQRQRQLTGGDPDLEHLADAVRVRVVLAAARRLDELLHGIAAQLSFRYAREIEETVGAVRGRLDVPRYIAARGRRDVPRRYPVRVLRRDHSTPENALAMYAAGWVSHEMRSLPAVLPPGSPEKRELEERQASLARTLSHPVLAGAAAEAAQVWRRGSLDPLLDRTVARLHGGQVAWPEPYEALVAWIEEFDPGAGRPGDSVDWAIYDDRFDPKLFEIWMLHQIAAALERRLGPPTERRPLWERGSAATYAWKLGGTSLRLHFQLALSGIAAPRWRWNDTDKPFDGVPDVTAVITAPGRAERVALVDAKLRQRDREPTEEIYKLLGYFNNRGEEQRQRGAIVFYAPARTHSRELGSAAAGRLLSLGVDPARDEEDLPAFDALAALLVELLDEADPEARSFAAGAGEQGDVVAVQARVVEALLERARSLPPATLEPFRRMLEERLPAIWPQLGSEMQTILVSAEYFGATAPEEADLSGPVLGLGAACERLLCGEGSVMARLAEEMPEHVNSPVTLGSSMLLKKAQKPREQRDRAIRAFLEADPELEQEQVLALSSDLLRLNEQRIAAAHLKVVSRDDWKTCQGIVLGRGDERETGLLARLVETLGPAA
jgi:hypothetical protein